MTKINSIIITLFWFASVPILISCQTEIPPVDLCVQSNQTQSTIHILSIGDSRIVGNTPKFESYRYHLWRNFQVNNWDIDFIGSQFDNGTYLQINGICFDNEHEGIGGATTTTILSRVKVLDFDYPPDIILLGLGGNDVVAGQLSVSDIIRNIKLIIFELRKKSPTAVVFIEIIAPGKSSFMTDDYTRKLDKLNSEISKFSSRVFGLNQLVLAVDMSVNWNDSYLADNVHYNENGAKLVADRYFNAIATYFEK